MKNQYFGDINDYRKYGLLRVIAQCSRLRLLVAWMLTPDDGSTDGKFISYLDNPKKWAHRDPVLFQRLKELVDSDQQRRVHMIEATDLIRNAGYFPTTVPDAALERSSWFKSLRDEARVHDFVFLDPDLSTRQKSNNNLKFFGFLA